MDVPISEESAFQDEIHRSGEPHAAGGHAAADPNLTHDVSDLRQTDAGVREIGEYFDLALSSSRMGVWDLDLRTGSAHRSEEHARIFGYPDNTAPWSLERFLGHILEEERAGLETMLRDALPAEGDLAFECRIRRVDGAVRWIYVAGRHRVDRDGVPHRTGIVQDITSRKRAEEELEATNARLSLALASGELGIWEWDVATNTLVWDDRMFAIYGIGREEFAGRYEAWKSGVHPDDRALAAEAIEEALRGQRKYDARFRVIRPDGETRHIKADGVVVRDAAGRPVRMIGLNRDLTGQLRMEDDLRESEYWLRESQRVSHIGSYVMDVDRDYWTSSAGLDQIFGIGPEYPRSTAGWGALLHPEDRDSMLAYLRDEVFGKRQPFNREYRIVRHNDGATRWVQGRGALVPHASGHGICMTGTIQDITERKQAELALRASEDKYHALFEQAGDGVFLMNTEGKILSANQTYARMHGYSVEEVLELGLEGVDVEGATPVPGRLRRVLSGETISFEVEHRHRDGHTFPLAVTANLITAGDQRMILAVHRDIAERKRAEAEREKLWTQLAQAQKMESIGRLAGGVAHDFNNLLTVINGYSSLALKALRPGDPLRELLEEIHGSGERAAALTRQLLAFSRKQILQPRVLGLNEIVRGMESMLRRLVGEDIVLALTLSARDPQVHADPHQIEQVLMNLAVNARDAMPDGGTLTVATGVEESADAPLPGQTCAVLEVCDTGTGMDAETRQRIFEPFFTTKAAGKGTGLGLSMVQGIIEQSGGRITVLSVPGRGTTFRIHLPLLSGSMRASEESSPATRLEGAETVLVVEDQTEVRHYVAKVLRSYGYRVLEASNAADAARVAGSRQDPMDLLLTDVVMPDGGGGELAARIKKLRPDLRVLFMSGYTDDMIVRRGAPEQGAAFVQKPFTPEELARAVRKALEPRAGSQ